MYQNDISSQKNAFRPKRVDVPPKGMVKKKNENGYSIAKIADDLLEDADVIEKIYDIVKENPEKTREEICEILMNQKI